MASVATIAVSLIARTQKFERQMRSADSAVVKFGNVVGKVSRQLARFSAAALAGAATASAFLVRRQFAVIDSLAKTSDKLGIATEDLQTLQFAAKLAGLSVETLNMGLQRMVRRIAEAGLGTGEAVKALKELGIDAAALNKLDPFQQIMRIADAFGEVENQADRVRLAMKLFDSEGVAFVNILRLGSDGLTQVSKDMQAMGLQLNRVDAAAVEGANDSLTKLLATIDAVAQSIAVDLAPEIQLVADAFLEWQKATGGLGRIFEVVRGIAIGVTGEIMKGIDQVIRGLGWLIDLIPGVEVEVDDMFRLMAEDMERQADALLAGTDTTSPISTTAAAVSATTATSENTMLLQEIRDELVANRSTPVLMKWE